MDASSTLSPVLSVSRTTTYPLMWLWNEPIEGKKRRGHPCKIVKQPEAPGLPHGMARRIFEHITIQFTDGTTVSTVRRAVKMRKWTREQ